MATEEAFWSLGDARNFLQRRQAFWASLVAAPPSDNTVAAALQAAARREANAVRDRSYIREGAFKYDAGAEETRWALTRTIIERVSPGPFEDPTYLEMLARQAASIELALCPAGGKGELLPETFSRIIVGTTGEPRSEAYSALVAGMAVLAMSAGMMDFMYQGSKALVLAWKQSTPEDGVTVSFACRPEDVEEVLDSNPYPAALFRDTLETWLYEGRPRAPYSTMPTPGQQSPITVLINGAERFVLAHEYGHALMHLLKVMGSDTAAPVGSSSPWDKEVAADVFAAMAVVESCARLGGS